MAQRLLDVQNLKTTFYTVNGDVKAVDDVSFHVDEGEIVAIVGESGCGKSVTQLSIMQLVQTPPGKIIGGKVLFDGKDLLKLKKRDMQHVRGHEISMIFQDPMTALNPVYTVGNQLMEVIKRHRKVSDMEAKEIAVKALEDVMIPEPEARLKNYPFEMSGGMRQRVCIALALAGQSKLIIADEPTTALDVTVQAQIMELLLKLTREKNLSLIVVTHNLGLVTRYANRIYVMYAGKVIESGTSEEIIMKPQHPYTIGLLNSVPRLGKQRGERLIPIPGAPPDLANLPAYCAFLPRCPYATERCEESACPEMRKVEGKEHYAACHLADALGKEGEAHG
ncbi:MAG: ABC transporter ATP-binding protein [Bacillota bacterium]|nr:ABC transporter ATP-binding protein [Bacillota bacterium]